MRSIDLAILSAFLLFSIPSSLVAQVPERGLDNIPRPGHAPGVAVLSIPGHPFTAHSHTDWTRTFENGATIVMKLDAILARDSQGRIYRENHRLVPANENNTSPMEEIHIYDPLAHLQVACSGKNYTCIITNWSPHSSFVEPDTGESHDGTKTLTRESLGTETIDGIAVIVSQETTTLHAGANGNDKPMLATRTFWYSKELQTNLAVTRSAPGLGKQDIRLSDIKLGEPEAHQFDLPIGFKIVDRRGR